MLISVILPGATADTVAQLQTANDRMVFIISPHEQMRLLAGASSRAGLLRARGRRCSTLNGRRRRHDAFNAVSRARGQATPSHWNGMICAWCDNHALSGYCSSIRRY